MPSSDQSETLRESVVRRWKQELFSIDTVISAVAVVVAAGLGLASAAVYGPKAFFAVVLPAAAGPGLDLWGGRLVVELPLTRAVAAGAAMAALNGVLALALFVGVSSFTTVDIAVVAGIVGGALLGEVAARFGLARVIDQTTIDSG